MDISVIVPALDEEAALAATLEGARGPAVREVIVVDGGSRDRTRAVAAALADVVLDSECGRARQLNAGAERARGDVFLFLHADTTLPEGFDEAILRALEDPAVVGGRFDVALAPGGALLRLIGAFINLRSRLSRIATGDQGIFVRRAVFQDLGGYPPIPLMEDVAFSRALKRHGRIACLRERVVTSSRRWRENGVVRTVLLMWSLRFLYACGVPADRLRRLYRDVR